MSKLISTVSELNSLVADNKFWLDFSHWDDTLFEVDDSQYEQFDEISKMEPGKVVIVHGGYLIKSSDDDSNPVLLTTAIKKWRKRQNISTIAVEIDNSKIDALKAFLKNIGGKII